MWLPGLSRVVSWRANRLLEHRRPEQAISAVESYTRRRPADPRGWVLLTEVLLSRSQNERAANVARDGLARHRSSVELRYLRTIALIRQGRIDEAQTIMAEAGSDQSFFSSLAQVELMNAREDPEGAIAAAKNAAEQIPANYPGAKHDLAVKVFAFPEARPLAESLLRDATKALPRRSTRYALGHLLLGAMMEGARPDEASRHLKEARKSWRSGKDLNEFLEQTRQLLAADKGTTP
jgi:tetratricopeptide (TPR) repeat protein